MNIYDDGTYLEKNRGWHSEDSSYKSIMVKESIRRCHISFGSCADVGCGSGDVSYALAIDYPQQSFFGFDLSKDVKVFWDRFNEPNLTFSNSNMVESAQTYDLILCLDVFEHIEDYFGFLRSIRPKGKTFIFNIPLDLSVLKLITPGLRVARVNYGHLHYFNKYTALSSLQDCGYRIIDARLSSGFFGTAPRNIRQAALWLPRLLLSTMGKRVAATLLGGYSLVVVATPTD